jgi:hypothetical protein
MRRSTVCWATFVTVVGGLSLAACSSSGAGDEALDAPVDASPAPADTGAVVDAGTPDSGAPIVDAAADAGRDATVTGTDAAADAALADATVGDAGTRDAAVDAAVDAGPVCVSAQPLERSCGICGKQTASCTVNDAGTYDQGSFGTCTGERDGGCMPGTEVDGGVKCGRCGRSRAVCQSDCFYAQGSCVEPPGSVCTPGERVFRVGLSCPNANEGRYAVCGDNCQFSYGDCTVEETWVNVSSTVGASATRPFTLTATKTTARGATSGTNCSPTTTTTPYDTTVIRNPTGKNLKIAIWESFAATSSTTYLDTVMNVFSGEGLPANRAVCLGANDSCSTSPCASGSGLAGFVGTSALTIGVGESLTVYTGCYSSTCTVPSNLVLNVRTLEILP